MTSDSAPAAFFAHIFHLGSIFEIPVFPIEIVAAEHHDKGAVFVAVGHIIGLADLMIRGLLFIIRILQNAVVKQAEIEIGGICFAEKRSVRVGYSDPVFRRDIDFTLFIGNTADIGEQRLPGCGIIIPQRKRFLFTLFFPYPSICLPGGG